MSNEVKEGEIVDEQTGEIIPYNKSVQQELAPYHGVSGRRVSEDQERVLTDPVLDDDLDILPTGEIYLSQIGYRRRLNKAFGPGAWALVPRSAIKLMGDLMAREYALFVEGRFISEAIGEQEYYPNNPRMSYATAAESVKSNALMRCCKDLGIASECWDRRFTEQFKEKYCEQIDNPNKNSRTKRIWVRKGHKPKGDDIVPQGNTEQSTHPDNNTISEPQRKRLFAITKQSGVPEEEVKAYIKREFGFESSKEITKDTYETICQWVESAGGMH